MPQLYFTSTQPPGAHRRIPVRKHDRADPRWAPATQRKKRVLPQRDASDNENVLTMFMKMKHMESELRRIKAFRRAECKDQASQWANPWRVGRRHAVRGAPSQRRHPPTGRRPSVHPCCRLRSVVHQVRA